MTDAELPLARGLYQHFKGQFYRVLEVARHSETEEPLVIYQALYGDKGIWARPLAMFTEKIERDGVTRTRFAYCDEQTSTLEVAILDIKPELQATFSATFEQAQGIIAAMPGYMSHQLKQCLENPNRYILLVDWQTLEAHTDGFRGSAEYQQWRELLHPFYDPFPVVEHYR